MKVRLYDGSVYDVWPGSNIVFRIDGISFIAASRLHSHGVSVYKTQREGITIIPFRMVQQIEG